MNMNTLIVGGTSGLGLEIARREAEERDVIITGRHDPDVSFAEYREFDLAKKNLPNKIGEFVLGLPRIDSLIYTAGFYQEGRITDLDDEAIETMMNVGGRALIYFSRELLRKQDELDEVVTMTSTSQFTPRELEPVYNFVKAGVGHFTNALSLDSRVEKARVIAPGGMDTDFWEGSGKNTSDMLDPGWVADQVMELRREAARYVFAKIPRASSGTSEHVEIIETRP